MSEGFRAAQLAGFIPPVNSGESVTQNSSAIQERTARNNRTERAASAHSQAINLSAQLLHPPQTSVCNPTCGEVPVDFEELVLKAKYENPALTQWALAGIVGIKVHLVKKALKRYNPYASSHHTTTSNTSGDSTFPNHHLDKRQRVAGGVAANEDNENGIHASQTDGIEADKEDVSREKGKRAQKNNDARDAAMPSKTSTATYSHNDTQVHEEASLMSGSHSRRVGVNTRVVPAFTIQEVRNSVRHLLSRIDNVTIGMLPKLTNLKRLKKMQEVVRVLRFVKPSLAQMPLSFLKAGEDQPYRDYEPESHRPSRSKCNKFLTFRVSNEHPDWALSKSDKFETLYISIGLIESANFGEILRNFCTGLNKMPLNIGTGSLYRDHGIGLVRDLAIDATLSDPLHSNDVRKVCLGTIQARSHTRIDPEHPQRITYDFEPQSFTRNWKFNKTRLAIPPEMVNTGIPAPPVPPRYGATIPRKLPEGLSDYEKEQVQMAWKHLEYGMFITRGCVADDAELKAWWADYLQDVLIQSPKRSDRQGPYQGRRALCNSRSFPTQRKLNLSMPVLRDLDYKTEKKASIPSIRINSLSAARLDRVVDKFNSSWQGGMDVFEAYMDAAGAADMVNQSIDDGEPELPGCNCFLGISDAAARHHCGLCRAFVPCTALTEDLNLNLRLCPQCVPTSEKQLSSSWKRVTRGRVLTSVERDMGLYPGGRRRCATADEQKDSGKRVDALMSYLEETLGIDNFNSIEDTYVPGVIRTHQAQFGQPSPFWPSVDAVLPFIRDSDDITRLHWPENIAVTARYLNFACNRWVKGVLPVVQAFLQDRITLGRFATLIVNIADIAEETPYRLSSRLGAKITEEDFQASRQSWRKLQPLKPHHGNRIRREVPKVRTALHRGWVPNEVDRIKSVVADILHNSPVKLKSSPDGCIYPFNEIFLPLNWSWAAAWEYFSRQISNMFKVANALWELEDDTETLYLETIFQAVHPESNEYRLFPNLPINTINNCPLKFSLGHKRPGYALTTGWTLRPEGLKDRNADKSNLSVETQFENYAKGNFAAEYYSLMREDFNGIKLNDSIFNEKVLQGAVSKVSEANNSGLLSKDGKGYDPKITNTVCSELLLDDIQGWDNA